MPPLRDYYKTLQVDPSAEPEVIEAAYKRLMLKYHPDINKSSYASEKSKQINEAYQQLRDPKKRNEYDSTRQYQGGYQSGSSYSHQASEVDQERKKREQAEREAYAAKQQAQKEHQSAEYERKKRRQAEAATQVEKQKNQFYETAIQYLKIGLSFITEHKRKIVISAAVIVIILLARPFLPRLVDGTAKIQPFWGYHPTSTIIPTHIPQIMRFPTENNTPITQNPTENITRVVQIPSATIPPQSTQILWNPSSFLFSDNFDDRNWTLANWESDQTTWEIADGSLKFIRNGKAFVGSISWTNYEVNLDVISYSTIDKIVFFRRQSNDQSYYLFLRSYPLNDLVLVKSTPSAPNHIVSRISVINEFATWHSIKVLLIDENIQIFINENLIINYTDNKDPILSGGIGIAANLPSTPGATVIFDNVLVTPIK